MIDKAFYVHSFVNLNLYYNFTTLIFQPRRTSVFWIHFQLIRRNSETFLMRFRTKFDIRRLICSHLCGPGLRRNLEDILGLGFGVAGRPRFWDRFWRNNTKQYKAKGWPQFWGSPGDPQNGATFLAHFPHCSSGDGGVAVVELTLPAKGSLQASTCFGSTWTRLPSACTRGSRRATCCYPEGA